MAQTAVVLDTVPGAPVVPGASYQSLVEVSFSTTDYLTGGVSCEAAILAAGKWSVLEDYAPVAIGPSLAAGIAAYSWDKANKKTKLYTSAAAECANALNISTIKIYFFVKGH